MKSKQFEQRLRSYKQQKYQLLLAKQQLLASDTAPLRRQELAKAIDDTLVLVDNAIATCMRVIEYSRNIESELKGYQIIEQQLEDVMFNYKLTDASTRMATNKLNSVGEHLVHLEQLLKYKD